MTLSVVWIILINHPDEPFAQIATLLGWRDRGDPVVTFILAVLDLAKDTAMQWQVPSSFTLATSRQKFCPCPHGPMDEHESWQLRRGAISIPAFVTMSRTWIEGGLPFQLRDPDFGRSAVYGGFSRVKGTTAVRTERALHGTGKGAKLIKSSYYQWRSRQRTHVSHVPIASLLCLFKSLFSVCCSKTSRLPARQWCLSAGRHVGSQSSSETDSDSSDGPQRGRSLSAAPMNFERPAQTWST